MNIKLTVFFDDPFWVGIFERTEGDSLETSRVVFGPEPKDYEVYSYVLGNYDALRFSRPVKVQCGEEKRINPKRLRRMVRDETSGSGVCTAAQQAIKLEYEARKMEGKKLAREKKDELELLKFEKRQEKKEKKKGH